MTTIDPSRAKDALIDIPVPKGLSYLPYQRAGVQYAMPRKGTLIADEMGLGKTIQAIGVANKMEARKILVVCPASLKYNWKKELDKWLVLNLESVVGTGKSYPAYADVIILNYEILHTHKEFLDETDWDLMIFDESHRIKNEDTRAAYQVIGGRKRVKYTDEKGKGRYKFIELPRLDAEKILFLTGTPILNVPAELWTTLKMLAPDLFPDQWAFWNKYCDLKKDFGRIDVTGKNESNLQELQSIIRKSFMIRRLKKDVLPDLPVKLRQVIEVPIKDSGLSADQTKQLRIAIKSENDFMSQNQSLFQEMKDLAEKAEKTHDLETYSKAIKKLKDASRIPFYEMARIRKEVGIAKIPLMLKTIEEELESTNKLIVFVYHHEVATAVYERFKANSVRITGQIIDPKKRQEAADKFQEDPEVNICICTIKAAGVGFTLTAASTVLFFEEDWVPANLQQAEDRAHRIGQNGRPIEGFDKNAVLVQHYVLEGSIDAKMAHKIVQKMNMIDHALDSDVHTIKELPIIPIAA